MIFALLLCGAQSLQASERPTMAEMQRDADRWILDAGKKVDGNPANLPVSFLQSDTREAILKIYARNWPAVTDYVDGRLEKLPSIDAQRFKDPVETFAFDFPKEQHSALIFATFMKSEDALLILRLYEPEALAMFGYSLLSSSASTPQEVARNAVISGMVTREIFKTELDGTPAIGMSSGYWTVVTAYRRSEHGLFVPKTMALFNRKFED